MSEIILLPKAEIQTTTFNYRSKEFFLNLKKSDIPTMDSVEWDDFTDYEEYKCKHGVNVNGIFIPGTLYFHLNHWKMLVDTEDEHGDDVIVMKHPDFRDNEWVIHNALWEAEQYVKGVKEKEMVVQGGCRQIGKTTTLASVISRDLTVHNNITDLIVCSSQADIDAVTKYIFAGMDAVTWFLRVPRITKGKDEDTFLFGHKDIENNDVVKSTLLTRNTQGGAKTQVSAGTTIYRGVFDEIGKSKMLQAFEAMKPAMRSKKGFRSSGMLTFTGGEVEKSKDAENVFYNPKSIGAKEFDFENRKTGLFLDGLFRQDLKRQSTVGREFGLGEDHELYDFPYSVRDFEYGRKKLADELEQASLSTNPTSMITHRIFQPMYTGDMFLTPNVNPFPLDELARHRENLRMNPVGTPVELKRSRETGMLEVVNSMKRPIMEYPIKSDQNFIDLDAPIMMYDGPKYAEHYNLHVIGVDPYNQDFTVDGESLGSVYVMRRTHSDLTDSYQNVMVASYTARPAIKKFFDTLEALQEFYNGEILFEDSTAGVLAHFDKKNKGHVLMDTMDLQKEINPKSKAGNKKGLKATVTNNQSRLSAVLNYLEEDLGDGVLGLTRILDPILIDEMIAYNGMGKGTKNTDRLDAFGYAILHMQSLQKFLMYRPFIVDRQKQKEKPKVIIRNAFGFTERSVNRRRSAFGF